MALTRKGFLKLAAQAVAGAGLAAIGGLEYGAFESTRYRMSKRILSLPHLSAAFDGFKLMHLTDLHFNPWTTPEKFATVVDMVNDEEPDAILFTGDFIDHATRFEMTQDIIDQLRRLKANGPIYGVLGNHDHWRNPAFARQIMASAGIVDLSNRVDTIRRGQDQLVICGLDDYWEEKQDLDVVLAQLPEESCNILLMHEPDYADISAATGRFAFQLSGHSHGGQVDIPFIGQPILPRLGKKYPRGLYQIKDMLLYTSTGVGMTSPQVRFNCPPEAALFTLQSQA